MIYENFYKINTNWYMNILLLNISQSHIDVSILFDQIMSYGAGPEAGSSRVY